MSLVAFDSNPITEVKYNNTDIRGIVYNGTPIWGKKVAVNTSLSGVKMWINKTESTYNHDTNLDTQYSSFDVKFGDKVSIGFSCGSGKKISATVSNDGKAETVTLYSDTLGGTSTFTVNGDLSVTASATAGSWHTIWTGQQTLDVSPDSSTEFRDAYTSFTSLSSTVGSGYKFRVTVSNSNVSGDVISTDGGYNSYTESSASAKRYISYNVYPPTYVSGTSVRIRVRTTDVRGFVVTTIKATKIEAYY